MVNERSVVIIGYMKTYESEIKFREDCEICVSEWKKENKTKQCSIREIALVAAS